MTRKLVSLFLALALLISCVPAMAYQFPPVDELPLLSYPLNEKDLDKIMAHSGTFEPITYPITDGDPIPLNYWCGIHANAAMYISNYDEAEAWQEVQKRTGVDLTFIHPAAGQEKVDFQLLTSDLNTMPDIIHYGSFDSVYPGGLDAAIEDGVIVDLTELLPLYAPDYWDYVKDDPMFQTAGGHYACLYKTYMGQRSGFGAYFLQARKDMLDEYGSVPRTIGELENYFQWILDNKPGIIPFAPPMRQYGTWNHLVGAFGFQKTWYVGEDGKVNIDAGAFDEAKDFLETMHRWWEKGYIAPDYLAFTLADVKQGWLSGKYAVWGEDSAKVNWTLAQADGWEMIKMPNLHRDENSGFRFKPRTNPNQNECVVITTNCKNVEAALKFLNYAYTKEGALLYNFGTEGVRWEFDEDRNIVYNETMLDPTDISREAGSYIKKIHFAPKFQIADLYSNPSSITGGEAGQIFVNMWTNEPGDDNSGTLPPWVKLTAEESERRTEIMNDISTYVAEQWMLFITGERSLDTFEDYKNDILEMGIEEAREITQAAYERAMAAE